MPELEPRLLQGDLLPRIVTPPPGPESRRIFAALDANEAPGINTLVDGHGSLVWEEAVGANVLDADGNRFLDLTSGFGVASIGHRHPRVVAAIREQSGRLLHALGDVHAHALRAELAGKICELAPVDDGRVYFAVSGSDAVEVALKTAVLATGRPGILAFEPAYHGVTLGSLAATSRPAFRRPFAEHLHSHIHRLPFAAGEGEIETLLLREPSIGALVLEPIVGREGVLIPPSGWLSGVAELCRRHRVLLIADEVFTGFGRTGHHFAVDAEGVRPDLLCCGKALGGGMPIAAAVGRKELMDRWVVGGEALHTATFVANPVACAAALAALQVLVSEDLARRSAREGRRLGELLRGTFAARRGIVAVRGRGMLWGIELAGAGLAKAWADRALERGLLVLAGGAAGTVLQVAPPLSIARQQIDVAVLLLAEAFAEAAP